ncbi:MAG: AMP-binding protein, partial [Actinomycetota bacterium]|nr:AMP-binding protein [Actinomycetota bacterium]
VPGDRVALVFDNRGWLDYAACYVAVLKAGAVAVPLGPRFSPAELAHIVRHCEARAVVATEELVGGIEIGAPVHVLANLEAAAESAMAPVDIQPSDLAEILYTSGTTGAPKGVACSHASILFHDPPPEQQAVPGPATFVHAFPVGTNAGQEVLRLPLRRSDRTAVALATFDPERYCAVVAERAVARLQLVPAMAQLIINSVAFAHHDVSSVERIVLSSAPSPPSLLSALSAAFPSARLWNTYALTEAGTARTLNTSARDRPASVGRPVGATEIRIVTESEEDLAAGATGEILLRRPGAPRRSYYRDPQATAATFLPDGWIRTGDVGYVDDEGFLYLVDRKKDLIIVGGLNVSSVEVESVLGDHPSVSDVAVFAVDHPILGQDVAAAVVTRSGLAAGELQAFARARLGEHKVPHHVFFVDRLPRTASGKVRKLDLRDQFGHQAPGSAFVAPRSEVEVRVVAIWESVLGRGGIGTDDDFFDLGGHSLAAAQIMARIQDSFSVSLPVAAIFDWPTPAGLAAAVDKAAPAGIATAGDSSK